MYSRKFQITLLQTTPNLRNVSFESNFALRTFSRYSSYIQKFTSSDAYRTLQHVQSKIHTFITKDSLLNILRKNFVSIPKNLKDQSSKILRVWAHQCECVVAQRLRRSQQMFCLYSKLWEENALREFMHKMRQQMARHGTKFIAGSIGIVSVPWDTLRITNEEMLEHVNEFDYVVKLKSHMIKCPECDNKNFGMCTCPNGKEDEPLFDNWNLFIDKDDLLIWRRPHPKGNFEYKVYGAYKEISAEDFLNVQVDLMYRRHWDKTAVQLEVVDTDPEQDKHGDLIYWELLWPRLFANRDYVFKRRFMVDFSSKTILLVNKSMEHSAFPVRSDKHRVIDYYSYMVIKPNSSDYKEPGLEFVLTYYDNPGVNIPAPITTWVAMRALPDFLANLREASKKYKQFCEEENHNCLCSILEEEACKEIEEEDAKKEKCGPWESNCIYPRIGCAPGSELMTSPSPMTQHENSKSNYWKYLHSSFYIS